MIAHKNGAAYPEIDQLLYDTRHGFIEAMDDDLNISAAIASLFKIVRRVNILVLEKKLDANDAVKMVDTFKSIDEVLNIFDLCQKQIDAKVEKLVRQREEARKNREFEFADKIRDQLVEMGVSVRDSSL